MKNKQVFTILLGFVVLVSLALLSMQDAMMPPHELVGMFLVVGLAMILLILVFREEKVRPVVLPRRLRSSASTQPHRRGEPGIVLLPLEGHSAGTGPLVAPEIPVPARGRGMLPSRSGSPNGGEASLCKTEGPDGQLRSDSGGTPTRSSTAQMGDRELERLLTNVVQGLEEDDTT